MRKNGRDRWGGSGAGVVVRWAATAVVAVLLVQPVLAQRHSGRIKVDGSSTVAPITMAGAEMFREVQPRVQVTVGISGTGGGFKKFLDDRADLRTDINDASRPITELEDSRARTIGVEYIEMPIALDGMVVVVHPANDFCDHLTVEELRRIWEPGSTIRNWKDVRPGFPDLGMKLYGPGTDSGTFDYFTEAIMGKARASRSDYTGSENDNILVTGVAGDRGSLGYFGFAYYEANHQKLKLVAIDPGDGNPVLPSLETIRTGAYTPLSRPIFLYVNRESAKRPEVRAFLDFLLEEPRKIVEHPRVGYIALPDEVYGYCRERLARSVTGSAMLASGRSGPVRLEEVFRLP